MVMPHTSVTSYVLPSEVRLGNGGSASDEVSRSRRVQQQVQMRMAEKSTLPRQNGSASHYATSEYGGTSSVKYHTYNPNFSSKSSYMTSGSRTLPQAPRVSQRSGFSARSSGPDLAQFHRISIGGGGAGAGGGGGGGGGGFYREDMRMGSYQGNTNTQPRMDSETLSMHTMRQQPQPMYPWMVDASDAGSLVSDRDAIYNHQYSQGTVNGYSSQKRQGGGGLAYAPSMQRSLSGTLSRVGGMAGGRCGDRPPTVFQRPGPPHHQQDYKPKPPEHGLRVWELLR
ncbi:unnamed protein product [Pleuronectes platessa]|uniref:Uncharacterized protein n=1 Tax=Pleuronectes platessa TaxID=8262 RepID=A0A9N7YGJ0_PLEPL|nr:unnamed protein product [Pleuronectes platessa]